MAFFSSIWNRVLLTKVWIFCLKRKNSTFQVGNLSEKKRPKEPTIHTPGSELWFVGYPLMLCSIGSVASPALAFLNEAY